ncbi:uncharacterized protein LOC113274486 [Papaver somniferum]|uniref:uncharacterized protein LOC113274486 n=1 Tax=Papaver somniferum TaxID=3469 RepID=UPI000E6FED5C|nr:uncharacterized protein LOC113274486 [Papaver somniferum]
MGGGGMPSWFLMEEKMGGGGGGMPSWVGKNTSLETLLEELIDSVLLMNDKVEGLSNRFDKLEEKVNQEINLGRNERTEFMDEVKSKLAELKKSQEEDQTVFVGSHLVSKLSNLQKLVENKLPVDDASDSEGWNICHDLDEKNKYKIASGALLPYQIIQCLRIEEENDCSVAELQWKRMVEDLSRIGKLKDGLAIADVSGSMTGTPMDVSLALGLLISEMSHEPWKRKLITFTQNPKLKKIEGETLRSKTDFIRRMECGFPPDFKSVFDQILHVAVEGNLKEDQMIKRLFVFSDMEFHEANSGYSPRAYSHLSGSDAAKNWETDYQVIQTMFKEKGYVNVPEIVFWNLRESSSTPVSSQLKGVKLVNGFSNNMVKAFLDENSDFSQLTPSSVVVNAAIENMGSLNVSDCDWSTDESWDSD